MMLMLIRCTTLLCIRTRVSWQWKLLGVAGRERELPNCSIHSPYLMIKLGGALEVGCHCLHFHLLASGFLEKGSPSEGGSFPATTPPPPPPPLCNCKMWRNKRPIIINLPHPLKQHQLVRCHFHARLSTAIASRRGVISRGEWRRRRRRRRERSSRTVVEKDTERRRISIWCFQETCSSSSHSSTTPITTNTTLAHTQTHLSPQRKTPILQIFSFSCLQAYVYQEQLAKLQNVDHHIFSSSCHSASSSTTNTTTTTTLAHIQNPLSPQKKEPNFADFFWRCKHMCIKSSLQNYKCGSSHSLLLLFSFCFFFHHQHHHHYSCSHTNPSISSEKKIKKIADFFVVVANICESRAACKTKNLDHHQYHHQPPRHFPPPPPPPHCHHHHHHQSLNFLWLPPPPKNSPTHNKTTQLLLIKQNLLLCFLPDNQQ